MGNKNSRKPAVNISTTPLPSNKEKNFKVLILGAGETGKSTIFKRITQTFGKNKLNEQQRKEWANVAKSNLLRTVKHIHGFCVKNNIAFQQETLPFAQKINALEEDCFWNLEKSWTPELVQALLRFCADPACNVAYSRRYEYQFLDSMKYLLDNVKRIVAEDFVPMDEDVILQRLKTTGIVTTLLEFGEKKVEIVDVGGQRRERKKWIHCFEDVTHIVFAFALDDVCRLCYEDDSTNRATENLMLLKELSGSRWMKDVKFIPVFTKFKSLVDACQNGKIKPNSNNVSFLDQKQIETRDVKSTLQAMIDECAEQMSGRDYELFVVELSDPMTSKSTIEMMVDSIRGHLKGDGLNDTENDVLSLLRKCGLTVGVLSPFERHFSKLMFSRDDVPFADCKVEFDL